VPDATTNDDTPTDESPNHGRPTDGRPYDDAETPPTSRAMDRALALATAARRRTAPNPWVGCVLVRDGVVVGEGATQPPGGAHAEIEALHAAGDRARGATAYVTLEPCAHHGRTGPCADALVAAGVRRVVIAIEDPDRRVAGAGIRRLRDAGIDVEVGEGAPAATWLLAPYLHHRRTGRPYFVAKIASSLDGRVAAADGTSHWITSADARVDAHELRADSQAIVIGSGTALADHPALTVRGVALPPRHPPLRVVLDARGRVPATGPLFDTSVAPTLVVTTERADPANFSAWGDAGAKVAVVGAGAGGGGVDLDETTTVLTREGVVQVLVEGGGTLLGAVLSEGRASRLVAYVAPLLLGEAGRSGYAFPGPATLGAAARHELIDVTRFGPDVRLTYEVG
jgi:diaminohydroxyphosphoribosylaminopyrimidine deaminase/5-amino-6-(5-phosphoribosylamino)uracil reductase